MAPIQISIHFFGIYPGIYQFLYLFLSKITLQILHLLNKWRKAIFDPWNHRSSFKKLSTKETDWILILADYNGLAGITVGPLVYKKPAALIIQKETNGLKLQELSKLHPESDDPGNLNRKTVFECMNMPDIDFGINDLDPGSLQLA